MSAAVLAAVSCGGDAASEQSPGSFDPDVPAWTVSEAPEVLIRREPGEICGAVRVQSGKVLVCDASNDRVEFYDPDGHRTDTWDGSEFEGGSFRVLQLIAPWPGDSVLALDRFQLTATVVHPSAPDSGRRFSFPTPPPPSARRGAEIFGPFADGSMLLSSYVYRREPGERPPEGAITDSAEYHVLRPDGHQLIGRYPPGGEHVVLVGDRGSIVLTPPLANRRWTAAGDSIWYVGWSDSFVVSAHDRTGRELHRVEFPGRPARIDPERAERLNRAFVDTEPDERSYRLRAVELVDRDDRLPVIAKLLVGPGDELWVGEPAVSGDALTWWVFDRGGRQIGRLTSPPRYTVLTVGADELITATPDGSSVAIFRVTRH